MNSGTFYYNYKGLFSIVLLAVVDADYKFLYCDIGANGAGSDAGIFNDKELKGVSGDESNFSPGGEYIVVDQRLTAHKLRSSDYNIHVILP